MTPAEIERIDNVLALAAHFGCDPANVARWPDAMREESTARMLAERRFLDLPATELVRLYRRFDTELTPAQNEQLLDALVRRGLDPESHTVGASP